jgi:hypothetical protein
LELPDDDREDAREEYCDVNSSSILLAGVPVIKGII